MTLVKGTELALLGGPPVYGGAWPRWPRLADPQGSLGHLRQVLEGDCWTVRCAGDEMSMTERFERDWAARCGTRYALAVTSGSAALELTLRALGVGPGQEVIVPALGWYATAAAVSRVGATPVFADVDAETTCVDAETVTRCLSPRTAAIIAVHLHCSQAELSELTALADARGVPLVEDAAQAHGGLYRGRPVGSWGRAGCFSFNQEKLLAAGEGGAVVTDDEDLYRRLYAVRTDGYRPTFTYVRQGTCDGEVQAANMCITELQAALLLTQLASFDEEHVLRNRHAAALAEALQEIGGVAALKTAGGTTSRAYYEFGFAYRPEEFGGWPLPLVCRALSAELAMDVHVTDAPVQTTPQFAAAPGVEPPPGARRVCETLLVFHHRYLLSPRIVEAVPAAIRKVLNVARTLPPADADDLLESQRSKDR